MEASHHTRRYLQALLVPSPRQPAAQSTRNDNSGGTVQETTGGASSSSGSTASKGDSTSSDQSDVDEAASPPSAKGEGSAHSDDAADDPRRNGSEDSNATAGGNRNLQETGKPPSLASENVNASSKRPSIPAVDIEARTRKVLDLLADESLEDDKPEKLKELLLEVTAGTESSSLDMDAMVLALMHRYREDAAPTGQSFNSPSPMPRTSGSLSRSSSFRRNLTPSSVGNPILRRSGMATPTRPISPSPLRAQSPSVYTQRTNDPFSHILDHANYSTFSHGSGGPGSSNPSSPFGSPRILSASASEFRPNLSAAEFKPKTPSLSVKLPEFRTRSPIGTPLTESGADVWAFQNSPLGTPKFATSTVGAATASHGNSYFGNASGNASATPSIGTPGPAIPSDPWNNFGESSAASSRSNPGISQSSSTASSEGSHEEATYDLFGNSAPSKQVASGKSQILLSSNEDEDEWGMPTTAYGDAAQRSSEQLDAASPQWNLYEDEDDDKDLRMLSITGGQLVPDDLTLVEPPVKQRPVFDETPQPQSTAQYSQLPQDFGMFANQQDNPEVPLANGMAGLNASSETYVMTPFDVLYSVFSGADISPAELEEALSRSGWDVDKAMEYILNNSRAPGINRVMDSPHESSHMFANLDLNERPSSAAGSHPSPRFKTSMGSGARPLVISRDSFQRNFAGVGRPGSPRWASSPNTPSGRSERSAAEGYFPSAPGQGTGPPSTRLCKYYLQGNCLRSDCRFSHDLSKAVCKFWLRGHCLKGEGRCEFLHSVPPHLAQDVAQLRAHAMRSREQEKARWLGRGGEEEEGQTGGRVEEDFPTLAAATASASARQNVAGPNGAPKDPATTRWAGAVKNGRPVSQLPVNSRPSLPRVASGHGAPNRPGERSAPFSQPRQSARLPLRPPTLLPTISTGAAVSQMYDTYRQQFFEYGNARNRCLVKAASCFRSGDGAGAKRWSREAQEWNRQIASEGVTAAENIVTERRRALKEAVLAGNRPGLADENMDRQYRGQECGADLGICLGVAAAGEGLGPEGARLSAAERTEVALDLHGLHPSEGVEILERFLLSIAHEGVMRGLVFVIVGQERHTGSADPARGSRKLRLIDAVGQWLDSYGYAFWLVQGVLAIDPYL